MIEATLICWLAVAPPGPLPPVTSPPQPDFVQPVDYLAWYADQRAPMLEDNALDMYGVFLYGRDGDDAPDLSPRSGSPAQRQFADLMLKLGEWKSSDRPELAGWIRSVVGRFGAAFVAADQRKYFAMRTEPDWQLLSDVRPAAIGNGRLIGQGLIADSWCLQYNALYATKISSALRANFVFARHLSCGLTLEEQFLAIGHRAALYGTLQRMLSSNYLFARFWRETSGVLATYDDVSLTRAYARSLIFSEAATYQLLQHFCTVEGDDGAPQLTDKLQQQRIADYFAGRRGQIIASDAVGELHRENPRALAAAVGDYYRGLVAVLHEDHVSHLGDRVRTLETSAFERTPALQALITPVGLAVQSAFRTEAQRRLARVFLHLAAEFKTTRTWVASLDDIDDPSIKAFLIDPLSGELLRMVPLGSRLLLYSVGPNGVDDGGSPSKDVVFTAVVSREPSAVQAEVSPPTGEDKTGEDKTVAPADRPEAKRD